MKLLNAPLLLLGLLAGSTLAEVSWTIEAQKDGKPVPKKDIKTEAYPPSVHRLGGHKGHRVGPHRKLESRNPTAVSGDWCGAVAKTPSTNKFTSTSGYFQVPTLTLRSGVGTPQYLSAWIGIDGYTWTTALLQAGITAAKSSSGTQQNWAWFEWVPATANIISSFPVNAGDWMRVIITATSSTAGIVYIENYSQAYSANITVTNGTPLGQVDGDWIVEDPFSTSGTTVPFPVFSDVWFEETDSTTKNGTHIGINSATMLYMSPGSSYVCKASPYDNANFWAYSQ